MAVMKRVLPLLVATTLGALIFHYPQRPKFILTTSPSMPRGIYHIDYDSPLKRGDIIVFRLSEEVEETMASRPWLMARARYVKRIGGIRGDRICRSESGLLINDSPPLPLYSSDQQGIPLPQLPSGCFTVQEDEFLPISEHFPRSFDGRYYGPLKLSLIEGVATLFIAL